MGMDGNVGACLVGETMRGERLDLRGVVAWGMGPSGTLGSDAEMLVPLLVMGTLGRDAGMSVPLLLMVT